MVTAIIIWSEEREEPIALSCEMDDLKKYHAHRLLRFRWYEPNY